MAIIYDSRGNEYLGQLDAITGTTLTDARPATASLGAVNAEAVVDLNGHATLAVDIRGTFSATLVFQGTVDGSNYVTVPAFNIATALYVPSVTATGTNVILNVAGYRSVRALMSTYASGAAVVAMRATVADFSTLIERIPATASVTATAAAGSATTLTLPAPGVGMYCYINWIRIEHFAAALLTAAAAPVIVTTTNLPGTPSFNFRSDAAPQGTLTEKIIQGDMPTRSTTANTAVTVVCPATPNVLWKATASYRVGA